MAKSIKKQHQIDWDDSPFAILNDEVISRLDFFKEAVILSNKLPDYHYAINLCKNNYLFALSTLAVILKGQSNILPPNTAPETIDELMLSYSGSYIIEDSDMGCGYFSYKVERASAYYIDMAVLNDAKEIDDLHIAAIVFTSGSTGKAKPNPKSWGQLSLSSKLTAAQFGFLKPPLKAFVATVPPQHMYGLETSILLPIFGFGIVTSEPTFYPDDLRESVEKIDFDVVLISTPVHLTACHKAKLNWNGVTQIISATAPLGMEMAHKLEASFSCSVDEIFGSTETGAIASRRTSKETIWRLFEQLEIQQNDQIGMVKGTPFDGWVSLSDKISIVDKHHFELLGRHSDMVKIAGKRASLADLTLKLNAIKGVEDGVMLFPDVSSGKVERLRAFVVAPNLTVSDINKQMLAKTDQVFLPRPLTKVDAIPRNATGKLTQDGLKALLDGKYNGI